VWITPLFAHCVFKKEYSIKILVDGNNKYRNEKKVLPTNNPQSAIKSALFMQ
jgi:hypothetical protein